MISRVGLVVSGGPCNYKEVISDQFIIDMTASFYSVFEHIFVSIFQL